MLGRRSVLVWDVETGQVAWTRSEPGLNAMSVAFSPDGKSLAVGYGNYSGEQLGQVKVWDVASGKEIKAFTGPRGGVNKVAFHPDGQAARRRRVGSCRGLGPRDRPQDSRAQRSQEMGLLRRLQPRREMAGDGRLGPDRQAPGRRDRRGGVDDLRARRIRPEPGLQPRRPHPRHDERGPERQALGSPFRPACRDLSRPYRLRPGRRFPARRPRGRYGEHGWFDPVLGPADQPSRRGRTRGLGESPRLPARRPAGPLGVGAYGTAGRSSTKGWNPVTGELDPSLAGTKFERCPPIRGTPGSNASQPTASATSPDGKLVAQVSELERPGGSRAARNTPSARSIIRECGERSRPPYPDRALGRCRFPRVQPRRPPARDGQLRPDHQALGHGDWPGRLHAPRTHRGSGLPGLQPRWESDRHRAGSISPPGSGTPRRSRRT